MKIGDRITFSGSYTVYDPDTKQTRIELNVILRSGIILDLKEETIEVFSNDEFCHLPRSSKGCIIHDIAEI
mgnify:CR=1 FL=1